MHSFLLLSSSLSFLEIVSHAATQAELKLSVSYLCLALVLELQGSPGFSPASTLSIFSALRTTQKGWRSRVGRGAVKTPPSLSISRQEYGWGGKHQPTTVMAWAHSRHHRKRFRKEHEGSVNKARTWVWVPSPQSSVSPFPPLLLSSLFSLSPM